VPALEGNMTDEAAADRIARDLQDVLKAMRADLDRLDLLANALVIFNRPIPDYEPQFSHLHRVTFGVQEFGKTDRHKQ
jgi:hypothetical protein